MIETIESPLVIGFTGMAKSGKDTAASAIASILSHKIDVEMLAFAEPIRKIGEVFGYTREQMENQSMKETYLGNSITNITPRKFMQMVGTDMFRDCLDKDIWVRFLESKIQEPITKEQNDAFCSGEVCWKPKKAYFITDVRFPNESLMVKRHHGFVIRVERPNLANSGDWRKHESEKAMSDVLPDLVWTNDSLNVMCWCGKAMWLFGDMMRKNGISID